MKCFLSLILKSDWNKYKLNIIFWSLIFLWRSCHQHTNLAVIVQSDSSEALSVLTGDNLSRWTYGHLVAEIKHLMVEKEFIPLKIKREQNRVADRLTFYSRTESTTAVWLNRGPPCIEKLLPLNCNSIHLE